MAEDLIDKLEETESDSARKSTRKIVKKSAAAKKSKITSSTKIVDSDDDLEDFFQEEEKLPALADEFSGLFENKLTKIEKQIKSIAEKQSSGVSAEFNALMDGYVNKANQSQEFKVKFDHLEAIYEELKSDYRSLKEENKKFKLDLEASREALRLSEADLQRLKKESDGNKSNYEEQVSNLIEERERLKTKTKQLMDQKEKSAQEYNDLKTELLEHKYKSKQLEQEKQVELETQKRSVRETNKIIDELKEKLDLRTREVEYKDALLNQLIKQVSAEETSMQRPSPASTSFNQASTNPVTEDYQSQANNFVQANSFQAKTKTQIELGDDDSDDQGLSWGAFKR